LNHPAGVQFAPRVKRNKAGLQGRALCHSSGSRAGGHAGGKQGHAILWNGITLLYPKGFGSDGAARNWRGMTKRSRRTNVSV
jgi:hypothetical protein